MRRNPVKHLCLIPLLLLCAALSAQPAWFDNVSNPTHIIGNGSAKIVGKDDPAARQAAQQQAMEHISHQIYTEVRSFTLNNEVEGFQNTQFYAREVQIQSCLDFCGAETLNQDTIKNVVYVQLGVRREALRRHYLGLVQSGVEDAIALNQAVEQALQRNDKAALQLTKDLRVLLDELARNTMILGSLEQGDLATAIPKLRQIPRIAEVDSRLAQQVGGFAMSFADLAREVVEQMKPELQQPFSFGFSYIEWLNTGFSSEFSTKFSEYLAGYLEGTLNWVKASRSQIPQMFFSGQLIEEGDRINLFIRFSGQAAQTIALYISPATINRFGADKFKPQNLEQRLAEQRELLDNSIQSNKLQVMVKFLEYGTDPAVFRIGDTANIFVRANKPCYLTLVNLESDGQRNVLLQNMPIRTDQINEWIPTPFSFTVTEPTGIEQIFIQADLMKLEELEVIRINVPGGGTKDIATGHKAALARTRGLMMNAPQSEYTEAYLTWTVLK